MREAPVSSRDLPPPSSRSEAAIRSTREALHNLAPGLTSKLNLAADCLLVVAAAAFSSAGHGTLQHTAWVTLFALGVWIVGARVLRHYDAWSEGLFGELAVTSVLVISVGVSLQIFNQVSLGHALHAGVGTFLLLTWPGVWFVRATVVAFRAWRHAPPEHVLIIGTGPLGRVTGEDIRDTSKHRQLLGYLSWHDDNKQRRLPASVLGRWDDLEICLKQNAISEVYVAGNPPRTARPCRLPSEPARGSAFPSRCPPTGSGSSRARPVQRARFRDGYLHFLEHRAQAGADGLQAPLRHRRVGVRAVGAARRFSWSPR